jgi:hypothetical protein
MSLWLWVPLVILGSMAIVMLIARFLFAPACEDCGASDADPRGHYGNTWLCKPCFESRIYHTIQWCPCPLGRCRPDDERYRCKNIRRVVK